MSDDALRAAGLARSPPATHDSNGAATDDALQRQQEPTDDGAQPQNRPHTDNDAKQPTDDGAQPQNQPHTDNDAKQPTDDSALLENHQHTDEDEDTAPAAPPPPPQQQQRDNATEQPPTTPTESDRDRQARERAERAQRRAAADRDQDDNDGDGAVLLARSDSRVQRPWVVRVNTAADGARRALVRHNSKQFWVDAGDAKWRRLVSYVERKAGERRQSRADRAKSWRASQ